MVPSRATWPVSQLLARTGGELGVSEWFLIDQHRIDEFAKVTQDDQFIHTDPDRARETSFGGTIAHGFLTLSLLSAMERSGVPRVEEAKAYLNYGFNKVRFLNPVPAGARLRARFTLASLAQREEGRWLMSLGVVIELEGADQPALIAEWLTMFLT
jgi:acyl dehydratase